MLGGRLAWLLAAGLAGEVSAGQVKLDVSMANPFLLAGPKQTTYLKVGLTGFEMNSSETRTPANLAIVLDKSGSMQGEKIRRAKEAATMAVERLGRNDIVSVIAYDSTVSVLVPATKATDQKTIRAGIERLEAGGSTALFAGVSKGADEVRKFLAKNRTNRIILMSDGLANVGPDTPGELGDLGASLAKEGISVTTIGLGLGYNEDLMAQLARRSDGNHAFVEESKDLAKVFKSELGDVLSVVAKEVVVRIVCGDGIRPLRVMGREGEVSGQRVTASLSQLYSSQEKYVLVEVEVPEGKGGTAIEVAKVDVSYANMATLTTDSLTSTIRVRYTDSREEVAGAMKKDVMVAAVMQVATDHNRKAVDLRDQGRIDEAEGILRENVAYLKRNAEALGSDELRHYGIQNDADASNLRGDRWNEQRKFMRRYQHMNATQQTW
jgi:Ca-activated chloride channel family protein